MKICLSNAQDKTREKTSTIDRLKDKDGLVTNVIDIIIMHHYLVVSTRITALAHVTTPHEQLHAPQTKIWEGGTKEEIPIFD